MDSKVRALEVVAFEEERRVGDMRCGVDHAVEDVQRRGLPTAARPDAEAVEGFACCVEVKNGEWRDADVVGRAELFEDGTSVDETFARLDGYVSKRVGAPIRIASARRTSSNRSQRSSVRKHASSTEVSIVIRAASLQRRRSQLCPRSCPAVNAHDPLRPTRAPGPSPHWNVLPRAVRRNPPAPPPRPARWVSRSPGMLGAQAHARARSRLC